MLVWYYILLGVKGYFTFCLSEVLFCYLRRLGIFISLKTVNMNSLQLFTQLIGNVKLVEMLNKQTFILQ